MSTSLCSLARLPVKSFKPLCVFPKPMSTLTAGAARIQGRRRLGPAIGSSQSSQHYKATQRLMVQSGRKNPAFASYSSTSKKLVGEKTVEKIQPEGMVEQIKYNPHLRTRFNQSLFNWVFSFSAVILAAQSLKSSKERQKVERKLEESETISEGRLKVLQSLLNSKTLEPLTQRILGEMSLHHKKDPVVSRSSWFSSSSKRGVEHNDTKGFSESVVSKILLEEMFRLVGEKALDEAQREVFMTNLADRETNGMVRNVDPEKLMVGVATEDPFPTTGPAEKRKKAFTM